MGMRNWDEIRIKGCGEGEKLGCPRDGDRDYKTVSVKVVCMCVERQRRRKVILLMITVKSRGVRGIGWGMNPE